MNSVKSTVIIHPNIPDRTMVDDRMRFLQCLERNLRDSFSETGIEYSRIQIVKQQIIVETHAVENIMKVASNVFGVVAVSSGESIGADTNIHSASIIHGIGGLPTGYEGRVVCMISSGLDSPVASFKAMRRGCVPIFVYFDNSPFSDDSNKKIAIEQAKRLSQYIHGSEVKMYIVPHGEDLVEVLRHAPRRMTCIFCRRNMYRLAQEVAIREEANAIITGEIIGEQASQTTSNLFAENSAIDKIPIIRPCIGDDKDEIVKKAREIGTYHFAEEAASCCSLPPKFPTINARTSEIPVAEEKIGEGWVKYAVDDAEIIVLKEEFKTG